MLRKNPEALLQARLQIIRDLENGKRIRGVAREYKTRWATRQKGQVTPPRRKGPGRIFTPMGRNTA